MKKKLLVAALANCMLVSVVWAENSPTTNSPVFNQKTLENGDVVKTITGPNGTQVVQTKRANGTVETQIVAPQASQPVVDPNAE